MRQTALKRRPSSPRRRPISTCSIAQQDAVWGQPCLGCGKYANAYDGVVIDPAHVWPRGRGADCGGPLDVIPLCRTHGGRGCHRAFDEGKLDILALMVADWPKWRAHVQHALAHADGPVQLLERLAGQRIVWG